MSHIIPFFGNLSDAERDVWINVLQQSLPNCRVLPLSELTVKECQEVKVAIVSNPEPSELKKLPNLVWIQSVWAGVERMLAELQDVDFEIVRMTDPQLAKTMAEAALAWSLYLHRDMPIYMAQQRQKIWKPHALVHAKSRNIAILGLGKLGIAAAYKLHQQGFNVSGYSRSEKTLEGIDTYHGEKGLEDTLSTADILIILLPLTPETKGLLSKKMLAKLPSNASIINFARGPIIDHDALIEALDARALNHAVLDVFPVEPLPEDNPLWEHPNVTILPHISSSTSKDTASLLITKNIQDYLETGAIPLSVNRVLGY